eukprot:COSAG05_NODE_851_length_6973_cov_6.213995_4_plen_112_part_00
MYFVPHSVLNSKAQRKTLMDDMAAFLGLDSFDWLDENGDDMLNTDSINAAYDHSKHVTASEQMQEDTTVMQALTAVLRPCQSRTAAIVKRWKAANPDSFLSDCGNNNMHCA